jgi:hypothetical protein
MQLWTASPELRRGVVKVGNAAFGVGYVNSGWKHVE